MDESACSRFISSGHILLPASNKQSFPGHFYLPPTAEKFGYDAGMNHISSIWSQVYRRTARSWRQILLIHLVFTGLSVILFAPLIGFVGRLLLKFSGQTALADQDIAYFLLSPIGLVALIIFAALLIAILAFEQAAIMRITLGAKHDKRNSPIDVLLYIAARAHKLWLFTARLVIRILILTLPLLATAALIARFLITDYDINFYLTEKPPEFWTAVILIGAVLFILLVILGRKLTQWCLALPLVLFGDVSPADSFAESERITLGQRKEIFALLLIWMGLSLVLGLGILGTIKLIGNMSIPAVSGSLPLTVILLGALAALWAVANVLITAFTSGSFANLLMVFYAPSGQALEADLVDQHEVEANRFLQRFKPKTITTAILLGTIVAGVAGIWLVNGIPTNNDVLIAAHRGAAGKSPENTLAAFQQAIDDQTDWIELDVQENADGDIVVMHDSDFMKLAGKPVKIWDATKADLEGIDIGSWYSAAFSSERVPTLKQVLELARDKAGVVIELKYYGHDENLEQRVIDIVEETDMVNNIAIMSLKYKAIKKIRVLRPDWTVGLLSATAIGDLSQLDTDFLAVAMGMVSSGFVRRAHAAGKRVYVWTVNDPLSMSRMISLGVDGVITDEPEMARRVLSERAQLSTVERLLVHVAQLFGEPYIPNQYRDNSP